MRPSIKPGSPCREYVTLASAFDFFNKRLFAGELPPVLITLQRQARSLGYYCEAKFEGRGDPDAAADEIALNPDTFAGRSDAQVLSTLVHEMVHLWQAKFGRPVRAYYHNHEWADRMERLGLMPSRTGEPGGRRVGQSMTHYIVAGGAFDLACRELLAGGTPLQWQSREESSARAKKRSSKTKYTCPLCGLNAWARPEADLVCGQCEEGMLPEDLDGEP